jgi:hypothetical protein
MVVKIRITICPSPPQLSLHRRAALSSNSNGTQSVYSRNNPKSSLYCEISMVLTGEDVDLTVVFGDLTLIYCIFSCSSSLTVVRALFMAVAEALKVASLAVE